MRPSCSVGEGVRRLVAGSPPVLAVRRGPFGGSDLDRHGGVDLSVGLGDRECAVVCEFECPSGFVDEVVVSRAQWQQVVEICQPVEFPGADVVDLASVERDVAAVEGAGALHRS